MLTLLPPEVDEELELEELMPALLPVELGDCCGAETED